jgi:hypothetical protein
MHMRFRLVFVFFFLVGGLFLGSSLQADDAALVYKPTPPVQKFYKRVRMISDLPRVVHPFVAADSLDMGPWFLVRVHSTDPTGQMMWQHLEVAEAGSSRMNMVYNVRGQYRPIFALTRQKEGATFLSPLKEDQPWQKLDISDPDVNPVYAKRRTYRRYSIVWDGYVFLVNQEKLHLGSWSSALMLPEDHLQEYRAWVDKQGWKEPVGVLDAKRLEEANFFGYAHNLLGAATRVDGLRDQEIPVIAEKIPTLTDDRKALAVFALLAGGQNPLCRKALLELIEKECNDKATTEIYCAAFIAHYQRQMSVSSSWKPDFELGMMMHNKILKVIEKEKLTLPNNPLIGMATHMVGG